jgi:hypothetical protein
MSHDYRPTVQSHADAFTGLRDDADRVNPLAARRFEDAMSTPRTVVPTGRCRRACPAWPCSECRSLSAASGGGFSTHKGTDTAGNQGKNQARKGRSPGVLSSLIPRISGGRLEVMNARPREQPADRSNAVIRPHSGPVRLRRHPAHRRACHHVPFDGTGVFDGAGVGQGIVAASDGRSGSCAKQATGNKSAGGVG